MGELNLRDCLIYLDDVIIISYTFKEHTERLEAVFSRLKQNTEVSIMKTFPCKTEIFSAVKIKNFILKILLFLNCLRKT